MGGGASSFAGDAFAFSVPEEGAALPDTFEAAQAEIKQLRALAHSRECLQSLLQRIVSGSTEEPAAIPEFDGETGVPDTLEAAQAEVEQHRSVARAWVPAVEKLAVVVWGAKGLVDADFGSGKSDAYCVARMGPLGAKWDQLPRSGGRRSAVIANCSDPEWNLPLTLLPAAVTGPMSITVRVSDEDTLSADDYLGEATVPLLELLRSAPGKVTKMLWSQGTVELSVMCADAFEKLGLKPGGFEDFGPIGPMVNTKIEDITAEGPLILGKAPLPASLRGIFWLTRQEGGSALMSFGGPSNDGGGCSTGSLVGRRYRIRVAGDRVWSGAKPWDGFSGKATEAVDIIYQFRFDSATEPTFADIVPESGLLGVEFEQKSLMNYTMRLLSAEDAEKEGYPGSVVWKRESALAGVQMGVATGGEYELAQVMDENGTKIEPAWGKFVQYKAAGGPAECGHPGEIFFHNSSGPDPAETESAA